MEVVTVNYWAVLVAGLASFVLGGLWYSPMLFGNMWMKLGGMHEKDMEACKKKGMALSYFLTLVGSLLMAYVLAHVLEFASAATWIDGVVGGLWSWLGFIAPVTLGSVLWEMKPWRLWILNNAFYIVSLAIMGAILAYWQ